MSRATRATRMLEQARIAFTLHEYEYDPEAPSVGLQAAASLGERPDRVLKTLMTRVDGKPACAILPADRELSMKKLAQALGGKSAEMMSPVDAERLTGYKVGGISPFGQMKRVPVAFEVGALVHALVYMNGGQRGLQVRLAPQQAVQALQAVAADLLAL
jgi:Cys-tRNA(Pro)/Cys-tRNA(Cys) deacylase